MEIVDMGGYFRATEDAMLAAFATAEVHLFQVPSDASPQQLEAAFAQNFGFSAGTK
jgi:hypothetical protein